ncbi:hypothetical protein R3I93_015353 [Phoxinus phoxinus]|uniref:Uncharacterized protein n=1 Tax=Phoxinus phoxinus TaxID=58324 RepID=A0AAN9CMR8_9TELE
MTTDGRKDLHQRPGPGRIRTRCRARQDTGENQRAQSREKSSNSSIQKGEPDLQGRIAYHVGHQGELSWSRSEQAKDGCPNSSRERKRAHKQSIRGRLHRKITRAFGLYG